MLEMTTERMKEVDEEDDRQVKLSDTGESVDLSAEKVGNRRGQRAVSSALATHLGGDFLLGGEVSELNASELWWRFTHFAQATSPALN